MSVILQFVASSIPSLRFSSPSDKSWKQLRSFTLAGNQPDRKTASPNSETAKTTDDPTRRIDPKRTFDGLPAA